MKVNVTSDAGAEMLKQEEYENVQSILVRDGSLAMRMPFGPDIELEADEWTAFAVEKEES